jgi:hypothetical protein
MTALKEEITGGEALLNHGAESSTILVSKSNGIGRGNST